MEVETDLKNFTLSLVLRIDWGELDYFGHVNNVAFFKYIQASRVNYWDHIGLTSYHKEKQIGPLLASCQCDFKRPLHYPGEIRVLSKVDHIGNTSFRLLHCIVDEENRVCAYAKDVMVMFDFVREKKVDFPNVLKEAIALLESRSK